MGISCEFLDAARPALPAAAEYLLRRYGQESVADLRQVIVVVPGSRAGRRLLELLVMQAEARGLVLTPPRIETVGKLPEQLYRPQRPFATDLTQRLVWAKVLSRAPAELIRRVMPQLPDSTDLARWMDLGDLLCRQHTELAADGLDFGDIAKQGEKIDAFPELPRWQALADLQQRYLRQLDELELWDLQTARLVAVDKQECKTDHDLIFVGVVDINTTLRRMLDQVAKRATALVFADPQWHNRFDKYGCLIPAKWADVELPIQKEQVTVVDGPAEQAANVVQRIASFDGQYRADEIVLGVPDEQLIPDIQRAVASVGLVARWGPGVTLSQSQPVRLLQSVVQCVEQGRFTDFASFVRHSDVYEWLIRHGVGHELLAQLDAYFSEHLPFALGGKWLGPATEKELTLCQAWDRVTELLQPFQQPRRKLTEWATPILQLLTQVYGERIFNKSDDGDRLVLAACEAIHEALNRQSQVPEVVMPLVAAEAAIRWLIDEISSLAVPAVADPESIEMLGWLELPLDDAPAHIVTSFNEGYIPQSVNSDLFLPNALRKRLGMLDNDRRYARDAYAISVMAGARKELHLIVARHNRDNDPLTPSRLLFAVDAEAAARRALDFFRPPAVPRRPSASLAAKQKSEKRLPIPEPRLPIPPIESMRITSFRDYLACPYRFYLRHVLKLEVLDDSAREMDGRAFGNLAHDVLSRFGCSDQRDSTDVKTILHALEHELNQAATRTFGTHPLPAILVQIEQLRLRLKAFAERQALRSQEGWRIELAEKPSAPQTSVEFLVDGKAIQLRGRIDRIDVHVETGQRAIWDYKTSDAGDTPEKVHFRGGQWVDLQLPLYRHLVRAAGVQGPIQLGYILLPKDVRRIDFCIAPWSDPELDTAEEVARDVVRRIRRQEFWPPARKPPAFSEDFAAICQEGVL
jgi:ATP-dependent helicase/nuclease subunit B